MKAKAENKRRASRKGLVQNKEVSPVKGILKLTLNLLPTSCRIDNLEGQEYTVVPMVILTEGVHSGSMGPLLYPKTELSKTPAVWNHKPIVVYHPTMNGVGVSACDPVIINSRKVGLMMNTKFEGGKLKSEAWIRKDRAQEVDDRIMAAINAGEMMELSTGVFVDVEEEAGNFSGEDYVGIAKNYRPDHLALLPDQIGACSIADGAGFLRNNQRPPNSPESIPQAVMRRMLERAGFASNELSHSDIHVALGGLLRERFAPNDQMGVWVMDVFSNFVVYENQGTFFRLGYTSNDTEIQLSNEQPVEVVRVSEYRTVQNKSTEQQNMNPEIKKLVDAIIGNAKWSDEDRERLGKLPKEKLVELAEAKKKYPSIQFSMATDTPAENEEGEEEGKVTANIKVPAAPPAPQPTTTTTPAATPPPGEPTPATNQKVTAQEYIAAAPKEIQQVLDNGLQIYNEEKNHVIQAILANQNNTFTEQELKDRPLNELRKMAMLMGVKRETQPGRPPQYAGQGPVPTENTEQEECLEMPALNFEKKK